MPKVSVIVPVYNAEKYLHECLDSIVNQTYRNLEIILVDDGSADDSGVICDEYANIDNRISVIHKVNGGQSSARNMGLVAATGSYITFIDSDDYYINDTIIHKCVELLESDLKLSFVEFQLKHAERNNVWFPPVILSEKKEMWHLWLDDSIQGVRVKNYVCDKVFRKEIFSGLKFPFGFFYEDRWLFPLIIDKCDKAVIIPNIGYYYRQHQQQTTRKKRNMKLISDEISADLNILHNIPAGMMKIYYMVYYRLLCNNNMLIRIGGKNMLPRLMGNLVLLWKTEIPVGIKIRLSILNVFGYSWYLKMYR